ncbi:hypothetical protein [uncultured Cedecea sp.]|uniref:hypothetical protein n=1 Tax=uncultured Cedecea sp. TaxID=988762 RepID=UPI002628A688|nr:hypothetical protein [uncultured Cedecea sp.]
MPISSSQHRVSIGEYQNNLTKKNGVGGGGLDRTVINKNEIKFFGSYINNIVNSSEEMNSVFLYQNSGITAPLLMLLCHIRLPNNSLLTAMNNPTLTPDCGKTSCLPYDNNNFNRMLTPLTDILYKTGKFISSYDPLKFPLAEAASIPTETISHYKIQDENIKKYLFYQLTGIDFSNISFGVPVEPFIIFYPKKMPPIIDQQSVPAEIRMDKSINTYKEHLAEKCQIVTKNNEGKTVSNTLLVSSTVLERPVKAVIDKVYDRAMGGNKMPPWLEEFTDKADKTYDIGLTVISGGGYSSFKYLVIKSLEVIGHISDDNMDCALNELSREELGRLMMNVEIGISDRNPLSPNSERSKKTQGIDNPIYPGGSKKTKGFEPDGIFVHQNMADNINTVRHMQVEHNGLVYYIQEKKPGEYWTHHPNAVKPELVEKRVYIDPVSGKVHFNSEMPDGHGLDYNFIDGKKFINIRGNNHEILWNWNKKNPEIVMNEIDGSSINIPVYMEPLSKNWHFSVHKGKAFFSQEEIDFIRKVKVEKGGGFYTPVINERTKLYGDGHIYMKEQIEHHHYRKVGNHLVESEHNTRKNLGYFAEMNGELVPVRKTINNNDEIIYTIYDLNDSTIKGKPIQWDGARWLFDKKTSVYISDDLKKAINPVFFSEKISADRLLAPDNNGLRHTLNGDSYIAIHGEYIKLSQTTSEAGDIGRYSMRKDDGTLLYIRLKDDGMFHIESFDERLAFLSNSQAKDIEHIYEEIHTKSEMPENSGLEYEAINGKNFIDIHGDKHEVLWNWHKDRPEIIINKRDGYSANIPVYMEPLSKTWHLGIHKDKFFFSQVEVDIIKKIKIEKGDFVYISVINENNNIYGNGHIYIKKNFDSRSHEHLGYYVEINGELVPVRKIINDEQKIIYTIYDLNNPHEKGYPIQWEGDRWLFEKKTSIYVSEDLSQAINPTQFSEKTSAGILSVPDDNGFRHTVNGDAYLAIHGKYIRFKKSDSERGVIERYSIRKDDGTLLYARLKDDGFFHIESFDEWLEFMHRLTAVNAHRYHNRVDSEHLYEEISFNNKMPEIPGLDYSVVDGKNIINIQGSNHEVFWNWNKNHPEIILKKRDGHPIRIPVYMEPISKTWHLSKYKNRSFFSKDNILILNKVKIERNGEAYEAVRNDNYKLYGKGHLYVRKDNKENLTYYVEMNGEIVPVRKFINDNDEMIYVIYDLNNPHKNISAIQWDGNRWMFAKKSSIYVSKDLINAINPNKFTEKVSAGMMISTDSKGLRSTESGDKYLLINTKYINIKQETSEKGVIERYSIKDDNGVLLYIRLKDDGLFHVESFNERAEFMRRLNVRGLQENQEITFLTYLSDESRLRNRDIVEITTKGSRHAESILFPNEGFGNFHSKIEDILSYNNAIQHLTDKQYSAVMSWRSMSSVSKSPWPYGGSPAMHNLNHALDNNLKLNKYQEFMYHNIISALNSEKYPTKESSFFRMANHRMGDDFSAIDNLSVGDVVTNSNRFMSVSDNSLFINRKTYEILSNSRDQVVITYRIDKASKAKPIYNDRSSEIKYEEEYLYLPESYFKVTGISYSHSSTRPPTIGVSLEETDKPRDAIAKDIFIG